MFQKITTWSLSILFIFLPLFFLPWTTSVLEQNKQLLLVVFTILAFMAWLGQMVLSKKLSFCSGLLNFIPNLFLLAVLVSSVTSLAGYQSWIGQSSQEYMSFLSVLMYVIVFYTLLNNAGAVKTQKMALFGLLTSATLIGVLGVLGMLDLFHLPFTFAQTRGFNTVGTINGFITFLTTAMFIGLAMWLVSSHKKNEVIPAGGVGSLIRVMIVAVTGLNLFALIAIDFWVFWVVNIFGVLLLCVFVFIQSEEFPNVKRFLLPIIVLVISVLFLFFPSPLRLSFPVVVSPSYGTSLQITADALSSSKSNFLFGTGPGTFLQDYLLYKPMTVNTSQFWEFRFDRAKSFVLTMLASYGVIGTLLWLILMIWIAGKAMGRLIFERDHESWKLTYVVFAGWAVLLLSHILYSSNQTLLFLLWGLTGLLASQVMNKQWKTDFGRSPKLALAVSFVFVFVSVGVLVSLFITGQRYVAEVAFAKAVEMDQKGESINLVVTELERAVKYNGLNDTYYRNLAAAHLIQARNLLAQYRGEDGTDLTPEQTQEVVVLVTAAVDSATRASIIEPNSVSNWIVRGLIYRDLMGYAQGAERLASQMFLKASQLEPKNPVYQVDLGRVYLAVSDRARTLKTAEDPELAKSSAEQETKLLETAEQNFNSAIELKADYLPAHYYLAAVYERQGRLEEAVARMAAIRNQNKTDIGVAFQLAQMLIRLKKYDLATSELERIVVLNPKYSNGLWYLASMYEIAQKRDEAIILVKQVVELNPGNELAKKRLASMQAGEVTTAFPEPIQADQFGPTDVSSGEIVEEQVVEDEVQE